MPRQRLLLITAAALAIAAPRAVMAQPQPSPPPGLWQQDTLTGNWGGLRTTLLNDGVTLGLQEQSEGWDNLLGGARQGAAYDGLTTASLRLDLDKLLGWHGATFFVDFFQIHGHGPAETLIGNLQFASGIEATDSNKLYDLWLEQVLLNGKLNVRIGQEAASDEMMLADDAAVFLSASFGYPAVTNNGLPDSGPNYPLATPFVRAKYQVNDAITVVAALYNGDPAPPGSGDPQLRDHTGTAFRLNDHALAFWEIWYSRDKGDNAPGLPGTYKLGVWYDSARFADLRFDRTGLPLANPASDGMPLGHDGDYGVYLIGDQMLWRPGHDSSKSISGFAEIMAAPANRNLSNLSVTTGLVWKAPLPGRDNDTLALGVAYERISGAARGFSQDLVTFTGSGTPYAGSETVIEATYVYQAAPWLALQPDAQYVINPGARIPNELSGKPLSDAFVVGVRATVTF